MAAEHTVGGSERGIGMDWYAPGSTDQVSGENERVEGRESEKVCVVGGEAEDGGELHIKKVGAGQRDPVAPCKDGCRSLLSKCTP